MSEIHRLESGSLWCSALESTNQVVNFTIILTGLHTAIVIVTPLKLWDNLAENNHFFPS